MLNVLFKKINSVNGKPIVALFIFMFMAFHLNAQTVYDTMPPYKKTNTIPDFTILKTDSTWFSKKNIPAHTPVVIIYFSPECGHCQHTAEDFNKHMGQMKNIFFIWVSYYDVNAIQKFSVAYHLNQYKNVVFARDPNYYIPSFYRVAFTPFMAIYNAQHKFIEAYPQGTDAKTIIKKIQGATR
jgi:peroxiredoxin